MPKSSQGPVRSARRSPRSRVVAIRHWIDNRRVPRLKEEVDIDAPADRVWAVVQEDATNAPKWSRHVARIEKLDKNPPGKGTRYRYYLDLPGGLKETLEVEQSVYNKPKRCDPRRIRDGLRAGRAVALRGRPACRSVRRRHPQQHGRFEEVRRIRQGTEG